MSQQASGDRRTPGRRQGDPVVGRRGSSAAAAAAACNLSGGGVTVRHACGLGGREPRCDEQNARVRASVTGGYQASSGGVKATRAARSRSEAEGKTSHAQTRRQHALSTDRKTMTFCYNNVRRTASGGPRGAACPPGGILVWWKLPGRVSLFSLRGAEDAEWTNEQQRGTEGVGVSARWSPGDLVSPYGRNLMT